MLFGAGEAVCFREVAALHSGHLRQVPLYAFPTVCTLHGIKYCGASTAVLKCKLSVVLSCVMRFFSVSVIAAVMVVLLADEG